jgi:ABC-type spermidine/putrescine transport system permease subunit I
MTRLRTLSVIGLLVPAIAISASLLVAMLFIFRFSFDIWTPESGTVASWTLHNYIAFFGDPFNYRVLAVTFRLSLTATAIAIFLGYPVAYLLANSPHKRLILFLVVAPMFMDVLVRAYGWVVLLSRNGLVNRALVSLGILSEPIRFIGTETAVVLELLQEVLPLMILPIARVLERIDPALREAAIGLGAGRFATFWRVTFPLSLPGVVAGTLLTFSVAASAFAAPLILGGGRVPMISLVITQQMAALLNWAAGSAQSVVLVVIVFLLLLGYARAADATRPRR